MDLCKRRSSAYRKMRDILWKVQGGIIVDVYNKVKRTGAEPKTYIHISKCASLTSNQHILVSLYKVDPDSDVRIYTKYSWRFPLISHACNTRVMSCMCCNEYCS